MDTDEQFVQTVCTIKAEMRIEMIEQVHKAISFAKHDGKPAR
jgi:hypothetical protein